MRFHISTPARILALAVAFMTIGTLSAEARHRRAAATPAPTCTIFCTQPQTQTREAAREARREAARQAAEARRTARLQAIEARRAGSRTQAIASTGGTTLVDGGGERYTSRNATVVGGRPAGCPHRFCGCGASLEIFGRIVPGLNLAAEWLRRFPHVAKANAQPGMAAARPGHVFVLKQHVSGNDWVVKDYNSGGGKVRIHVRSIASYTVVDPRGSRTAMASY